MQHFPAHDLGDVSGTGFEHLGHVELGGEENVQVGLEGGNFAKVSYQQLQITN